MTKWNLTILDKLSDDINVALPRRVELCKVQVIIDSSMGVVYAICFNKKSSKNRPDSMLYFFKPRWTNGADTIAEKKNTPGYILIDKAYKSKTPQEGKSKEYLYVAKCVAVAA